jgi:two-component system response regulator DevR
MAKTLDILLVDDHEIVRLGLKEILSDFPQFKVVGEAGDGATAIEKALKVKPDVILMDIRMPKMDGVESTRRIMDKLPDTKVIILTSYADDDMLFGAINAGAYGYVLKQIGSESLVDALKAVSRGEEILDPSITQRVLKDVQEAARGPVDNPFAALNSQEVRILANIPKGKTNKEIAEVVCLSEKTVRNYVSSILSKLNLKSRSEAAAYAVKHNVEDYLPME